ncbi:10 TM domain-containing transmembrane protein [Acrasis kona]|uniref:10 TM domain-containing transmembrane protein n=1 Tax=Acrasis kona TaxID=1008807 RepID=A0AAW2ZF08_9EUKA
MEDQDDRYAVAINSNPSHIAVEIPEGKSGFQPLLSSSKTPSYNNSPPNKLSVDKLMNHPKLNHITFNFDVPSYGNSVHLLLPSQRHAVMDKRFRIRAQGHSTFHHKSTKNLTLGTILRNQVVHVKKWWHTINKIRHPHSAKTPYKDLPENEQRDVRIFIVDFGYAMGIFNTPAHRIEQNLMVVSNYYGVLGSFFVTPTGTWFNFGNIFDAAQDDIESGSYKANERYSSFVRTYGSTTDMKKLMDLDRLVDKIAIGELQSAKDARKQIKNILKEPSLFQSPFWTILYTAVRAASFAVVLDGTWGEIIAACIGGLLVGVILSVLQSKIPLLVKISTGLCAFVCGMIAIAMKYTLDKLQTGVFVDVSLTALSGVVVLFPGMKLTTGIDELIAGHVQSGTFRIVNSLVTVIGVGFGLLLATTIDEKISGSNESLQYDRQKLPDWMKIICLPPTIILIIISFKVPRYWTSYLFVALACSAGYFGDMYWTRLKLSKQVAGVINACLIGFIANLYSFFSLRPSTVVSSCAIFMLVPGYASTNSINLLLQGNVETFVTTLFSAVLSAASLVIGMVISEMIFWKHRGQLSY